MRDYFNIKLPDDEVAAMSMLALAHIGDAVYELMVRTWLCLKGKVTNKGLHRAAVTYVSAPAQAKRVKLILPILTEEEQDVYRRARNSHTAAIPKGASVGEYQAATGLEALFGWLYLQGRLDRLNELFERMMTEE